MTKRTLVKESVVRRWGKLANMAPLTENWLDNLQEEEELDMGAEEVEDLGGDEVELDAEVDVEMDAEPEVPLSEEEAEALVSAIADAISNVTGQQVEAESDADLADAGEDLEAAGEDLEALADEEAGMGMPHAYNRTDEEIDVDLIDDESLTETVLQRVVERLLRNQ